MSEPPCGQIVEAEIVRSSASNERAYLKLDRKPRRGFAEGDMINARLNDEQFCIHIDESIDQSRFKVLIHTQAGYRGFEMEFSGVDSDCANIYIADETTIVFEDDGLSALLSSTQKSP